MHIRSYLSYIIQSFVLHTRAYLTHYINIFIVIFKISHLSDPTYPAPHVYRGNKSYHVHVRGDTEQHPMQVGGVVYNPVCILHEKAHDERWDP